MTKQSRGLGGSSSSETTTEHRKGSKMRGKFLISHRGGPFLMHIVDGCDPGAERCNNGFDNLIDQGFVPCPKCMKK
ncbi:hypothetical protein LCGC14_0442500 [marine sediment metagenome]|uniref:Uncharacterized protein n=1 Tax=marine sediment metagenome TaxID=412755 RepID=A0A0F9SJV3_9ZZZZ